MALSLLIKKTSTSSDGTKITLSDVTGNYNATTNPSGYGSPNDARAVVALFPRVYSKRYDKTTTLTNTLLTLTPDNASKIAVANWDVTLPANDSWIQATIYGLHLYSTSTLFQIGELTYDTATSQIRKIKTVSGSGPYTYTYDVVAEDQLDVATYIIPYKTVYNTNSLVQSCECHYNALKIWNVSKSEEDFKNYLEVDALLKSAKYNFGFGSYSDGQKVIESIEQSCTCINENCNC